MGFITKILNLFSSWGQKKSQAPRLPKDQLIQSIEAFKNRPIHKELTEPIIDDTPDDNLLQVVFDNLSEKQPIDYEREYETIVSWNKSRQAIYMIRVLEAEVNNGGFNQFYCNPSGQYYDHLPQAFDLIGARQFAILVEKANRIFITENQNIRKHQDGTLEGFSKSYSDNPLNDLDKEFYALCKTENLQRIQIDYIRRNKKEFIDN